MTENQIDKQAQTIDGLEKPGIEAEKGDVPLPPYVLVLEDDFPDYRNQALEEQEGKEEKDSRQYDQSVTSGPQIYGGQQVRIEDIIDVLLIKHPDADVMLVQRAYIYAATAHQGMVRRNGEPYLNHPLAVAALLADMNLDAVAVTAGLLHDTIEDDTNTTYEDIASRFGNEVAAIVDGVTKIGQLDMAQASSSELKANSMRKMILGGLTDVRVILVKLADRLHNMRTLGFMPLHKQKRIAEETLDIFAPLAARLGIHKIQTELEDLCLFYLEQEAYSLIRTGLASGRQERQDYIKELIEHIRRQMEGLGINAQFDGRSKHIYSIWKKMRDQNLPFEQIFDLIAFRIIVDDVSNCYSTLGVLHSVFKPIPGRFKDYVSLPKSNGYQSLHTAIIGLRGMRVEVQIRTHEMHVFAEDGIAAHWRYKDKDGDASQEEQKRIAVFRSIINWQQENQDPNTFVENLRVSLADNKNIFVFTPTGEVRELPMGSGPIDFAYTIHTMVGHTCVGAKVNGTLVSLKHKLQNGDMVEVLTSHNTTPSRDWLSYVVTPKAKARIRQWFASEERERAQTLGQDIIANEMKRHGISRDRLVNPDFLRSIGYTNLDDLNSAVAFGRLSLKRLIDKLKPGGARAGDGNESQAKDGLAHTDAPESGNQESGEINGCQHNGDQGNMGGHITEAPAAFTAKGPKVMVRSSGKDLLIHRPMCCAPVPGEEIVGYLTSGAGLNIHSIKCPALAGLDPERLIEVRWDDHYGDLYDVYFIVQAFNRPRVLAPIVTVISDKTEDIVEAHAADTRDGRIWFKAMVRNKAQYDDMVTSLKALTEVVVRVERFFPEGIEE